MYCLLDTAHRSSCVMKLEILVFSLQYPKNSIINEASSTVSFKNQRCDGRRELIDVETGDLSTRRTETVSRKLT
jgi:hypothetical protein